MKKRKSQVCHFTFHNTPFNFCADSSMNGILFRQNDRNRHGFSRFSENIKDKFMFVGEFEDVSVRKIQGLSVGEGLAPPV